MQFAFLHQVRNCIHQVVHVVPIVIGLNVLVAHVALVGFSGCGEPVLRLSIVADAIKNVARHVDHVAGIRRKAGEK